MKKNFIKGFLIGAILFGTTSAFATITYTAYKSEFPLFVNGQKWESEKSAVIIDGSTYLPLKALGEALDVDVIWNEELRQINVETLPSYDIIDTYFLINDFLTMSDIMDAGASIYDLTKDYGLVSYDDIKADMYNGSIKIAKDTFLLNKNKVEEHIKLISLEGMTNNSLILSANEKIVELYNKFNNLLEYSDDFLILEDESSLHKLSNEWLEMRILCNEFEKQAYEFMNNY